MKQSEFTPTITPITKAIWEYLGRLHPALLPAAGVNWREYIHSGGPAKYIGKR